MSANKNSSILILIEELFDQIHELQDFIHDSGLTEKDFREWQNDKDNDSDDETYH
tara:strand:- start:561 stop:725 length:165 start_codon:yes stop_codon:yes gene_type:complete